jgi:Flp pilus assembly pilin Flp
MRDLRPFWRDDQGQGMVEYALIIAVIALAILITQVFFASQIKNFFSNVGNSLT